MAAVLCDVFQPLDVRLGITIYFTDKAGILPNMDSSVGRETSLEDRPVRRSLCREYVEKDLRQNPKYDKILGICSHCYRNLAFLIWSNLFFF